MAWITDSLKGAIAAAGRLNPFGSLHCDTALPGIFTHQLALAAYMASGLMRKTIVIPAADRTQKWRDWQTDKDTITLIEAEEKRLGLRRKTKHAEILRGVGGGAMILVTAGDHAEPLDPATIGKGGLIAINVVSRWQITPTDFDDDLASPTYGEPRKFTISSSRSQQDIHPSRVVCFRGDPIPQGSALDQQEAFWGDSRLLRVFREVVRSDDTQEWFAALVRKAKLMRFGVSNLTDYDPDDLAKRITLIAQGESSLNAVVYNLPAKDSSGGEVGGEKIDDYQITWTGIPAMMDAFDQRVAAVSDIPFTRLTGRSPAGMNSTGEHDSENYNRMVSDGQENETRPCLEHIDPLLLRSAGVAKPDDVWWTWAPLEEPDEKERAETFKLLMEAVDKLILSGLVPERALAEAVQNLIEERGDLPGLADALAKISETERFGGMPGDDPDEDPSAMQAGEGGDLDLGGGAGAAGSAPARRAANDARFLADAAPKTLYIERKLLNADEVIRWAKSQGLETTLAASDMHVTIAYSHAPVDWFAVGTDWSGDENGRLRVKPGGPRTIERLGEGDAVALLFSDESLEWRHKRIVEAGASWDWPEYRPRVTLTWQAEGVDVSKIEPYTGPLVFGPELFSEVDEGWSGKVSET